MWKSADDVSRGDSPLVWLDVIRGAGLLLVCGSLACGVDSPDRTEQLSGVAVVTSGPAPGEWFVDRAEEAGLDFVHDNGMSGEFYQTEIMGPGVALFD
ncbi:MAG: hypothetical protein VYE68_05210, partial [Acidobacteriota bacterium]|nr:hypothetical protein [Acidobacteriota bacterium]